MMKRNLKIGMILLLLVSFIIISTNWNVSAQEKKPTKTLKMGFLMAQTGPGVLTDIGKECNAALEAFLEDLRFLGGIKVGGERYMIDPIKYDDKGGNVAAARDAINRLIFHDEVKFVGWTGWSPTTLAIQPLIEENKVLAIGDGGAPEVVNANATYYFRTFPPAATTAPGMYKWIAKNMPRIKKVAIITNDDSGGRAVVKYTKEACAELGLQVVAISWVTRQTADVMKEVAKAMAAGADILETSYGNTSLVVKQSREMGYQGPIMNYGGYHPNMTIKTLGWQMVQKVISCAVDPNDPILPKRYANFVKRMQALGQAGSWWSQNLYDGVWILKQAIEKANSLDPKLVRNVMYTEEFDVLTGKARFIGKDIYGVNNQLGYPVYFSIVEEEKYKILGKIDTK